MASSSSRPRKVILVLRLSYASQRDILHGISGAVRPHGAWRFHVVDYSADTDGTLGRAAVDSGADGVIVVAAALANESCASWIGNWNGPLVEIGPHPIPLPGRLAPFSTTGLDDEAVGRRGAAYLESLGRFRSFGFYGWDGSPYEMRASGFCDHFAAKGVKVRSCSRMDTPALTEWLHSLPHPAAVMAIHDAAALDVLAAAAEAGLRVPDDLAVLGVDNDESLCETASPPLTSIAPDHVRLGRLATEALRRRMERPDAPPDTRRVTAMSVVERQSTRPLSPAVALAERAMGFIRRNATRGIGAADVVAHLGVSRTLAGLRFRQVFGESMMDAILRERLETAKRQLTETDTPVGKLAAACGFRSPKHAMRLFKARFGYTMREWRRKGRPGNAWL